MQTTIQNTFTSSSSAQPTLTPPKEGIMKNHTVKIKRFTTSLLLVAGALIASGTAADAECVIKFYRQADFIAEETEVGKTGTASPEDRAGGVMEVKSTDSRFAEYRKLINTNTDVFGMDEDPNKDEWGDLISSVEFTGTSCGNTVVELYEHIDFGGEMLRLTQNVSNLKDHNFNDDTSSIKVYFDIPVSPNWSFYRGVTQGGWDRDIAAAADGSLKIISGEGYIYNYTASGDWQEMYNLAQASRIAVDPQGMTWIVQEDGTIYRFDPVSGWQQIRNALAKDIGVGADGTVMIISSDGYVFKFLGAGAWQAISNIGSLSRIAVAPDGMAWVVEEDGTIHRQTGLGIWELVHRTTARDISVSADGIVWIAAITGGVTKLMDPASSELTDAGTIRGAAMNISAYHHAFAVGSGGTFKEETYADPDYVRQESLPFSSAGTIEFDGTASTTVIGESYALPNSFTFSAEMRVDASSPHNYVIEIGGTEAGNDQAFRLEVANEGEWYVAFGDRQSWANAAFMGLWNYGEWTAVTVTYDGSVCYIYENRQLIHTFVPNKDVKLGGTLVLGSLAGTSAFFDGALRNVSLEEGVQVPQVASLPFSSVGTIEFDGTASTTVIDEYYLLPNSFTFSAEMRVDASSPHHYVIEIGGTEAGYNEAFRLEVANEGQWYVAFGDRQSYADAEFMGGWTYGAWTAVTVTYDGSVCYIYENRQLIHTFVPNKDVKLGGTLVLGSLAGTSAFFDGALRNVSITEGVQVPQVASLPFSSTETMEFDGTASTTVIGESYALPNSFTFSAEMRVDASSPHNYVIEIGGTEAGYEQAFRLEVANEGQWYVAFGDRQSYADAEFMGGWTYGAWTQVTVTYDQGVCNLYENDQLIHTFTPDKDVALGGTLFLGSLAGTSAFFDGALRNMSITEGVPEEVFVDGGGSPVIPLPTITLNGPSEVTVQIGEEYTEEATASDYLGGDLPVTVDGVVGEEVGTYTLTYTATNSSGYTATATRTVYVTRWQEPLPGVFVKDLGVGSDGTVWMVGMDGAVLTLGAAGFSTVYNLGSASNIAVQPDGNAWVVIEDGSIHRWDPASGWEPVYNALARDIGVGADGTVWIVALDGAVLALAPTGWGTVYNMGSVVSIAVQPDGNAWVVTEDGSIHRWDPASGWVPGFSGLARDIGVGDEGTEWIVGLDGQVHRFGPTGLENLHLDLPGEAMRVAVDAEGNAWVAMEDGTIFRWTK